MSFFSLHRLSPKRYDRYRDEMRHRNDQLLAGFSALGTLLAGLAVLTRIFVFESTMLVPFGILFLFFLVLTLARPKVVGHLQDNSTLLLYIAQLPVMVIGILVGTVFDPQNASVTFMLLIMAMPLFILDKPWRVALYIAICAVAYALAAYLVKPPQVFAVDMAHLVVFSAASVICTMFLLADRFDSVQLFVDSDRAARTDMLTGMKNRYALETDKPGYTGRELVMGMARIDDIGFFNDMLGHDIGDRILRIWADALIETFGWEYCYRFSGQEVLVIDLSVDDAGGISGDGQSDREAGFRARIEGFQSRFLEAAMEDLRVRPTCSVGFVWGTAGDIDDQSAMIRHADVRLYEARRSGKSQVRGSAYDRSSQRDAEIAAELRDNLQSDSVDELTGLPNMQYFCVRARNLLDNSTEIDRAVVFVYFDLENFKSYNEEYGFQRGDELLREIGRIISEAFPRRMVSRFSEDHFVVMCYEDEIVEGLAKVRRETLAFHRRPSMPIKAGVYLFEDMSEDIGTACDRAKVACLSIKERYDQSWRMYDAELREAEELRQYVVSHIDEAVEKGWLRVFYQPIISVSTREVVEYEALARWDDPVRGLLAPDLFIGALEQAHLIHKVDLWMVDAVCREYQRRAERNRQGFCVSVNLSRLDFKLCDVVAEVATLCAVHGVPANALHLEVTESALADDLHELIRQTDRLRGYGFQIWLDDFGSEYSSLNALQDFECDVVKLDMKFLRSFEADGKSAVIIESVVRLVQSLGSRALAEGVETEEHLDFLREIGCDFAQGYLIGRPCPME